MRNVKVLAKLRYKILYCEHVRGWPGPVSGSAPRWDNVQNTGSGHHVTRAAHTGLDQFDKKKQNMSLNQYFSGPNKSKTFAFGRF